MAWKTGAPQDPTTIPEWINHIIRRLDDIERAPSGVGRGEWVDIPDGSLGANYQILPPYTPCWRWLNDGRVELRGRVIRRAGGASVNGDILFNLPYECAPPNNEKNIYLVSTVALAENAGNGPATVRVDIQREVTWRTQPVLDIDGKPVIGPDGQPVLKVVSEVQVILRPPEGANFNGWVGLDHVTYDPRLYLDALPTVPYPEEPLVPDDTIVIFEHPSGTIDVWPAGVSQPADSSVFAQEAGDSSAYGSRNVRDPYRLLAPSRRAKPRRNEKGGV